MISPATIAHVQASFGAIAQDAPGFTTAFHARLFELDPSLRPMFKGDLREQGRKLATMLTAVVRGLNDLSALAPVAQSLAWRHVGCRVKPAHYDTVGAALMDTPHARLGAQLTPDVRQAWLQTYALLANVMKDAPASTAP